MVNSRETKAFRDEKQALSDYLECAQRELAECGRIGILTRMPSPLAYDTDAVVQEARSANKKLTVASENEAMIRATIENPYYQRFDVMDEHGSRYTFYVGEHSAEFKGHRVFQWQQAGTQPMLDFLMRNEDVYFTSNEGRTYSRALNRHIFIKKSVLQSVNDEYVSGSKYAQQGIQDPFLIEVIRQRRKDGHKNDNIISTIQKNQYEIVRYPTNQSFVVQGCAGSGKTHILMNRLSYILYNKSIFHLVAADVLVISPNPRVRYQIAHIVSDLQIDEVEQIPVEDWYLSILKETYSTSFANSIVKKGATLPKQYINEIFCEEFFSEIRGELSRTRNALINDALEIMNDPIIRMWAQLRTTSQLRSSDLKSLSDYIREISLLHRQAISNLRLFCVSNSIPESSLSSNFPRTEDSHDPCQQQLRSLSQESHLPDSQQTPQEALMAQAIRMRDSLLPEEQAKKIESYARKTANLARVAFSVINQLIQAKKEKYNIFMIMQSSNDSGMNSSLKRIVYRSDLFLYLYAACVFDKIPNTTYKLICFDEAQDISSFEYRFLLWLFRNKVTFNIFGDLLQGRLGSLDSIQRWDDAFKSLPVFNLRENYRNALQITDFVNYRFAQDMLAIGINGKAEEFESSISFIMQKFRVLIARRSPSTVIIVKDQNVFERFLVDYKLNDTKDKWSFNEEDFGEKSIVMFIDEVRGLEFPRVIVIESELDSNQLYIAMTRAISELYIIPNLKI